MTDGFSERDEGAHARRIKAFATLAGSCPDFPDVEPNRAANLRREWE
ncbi:MAG: hypothetical protein HY736_11035 [Verrucomicrobia bacterium]|nr:hypothetical protein [Verrucomicrobiota bacterium]